MFSQNDFAEDDDVTAMIDEFIAVHGEAELLDKIKEDIAGILEPEEVEKVEICLKNLGDGHAALELNGPEEITHKLEEALSEAETNYDV